MTDGRGDVTTNGPGSGRVNTESDLQRVEIAVLAPDDVGFDATAFGREHGFGIAHAGRPEYTDVAVLPGTSTDVIVLVPDPDGPSILDFLDALRERTELPVVLYDDDVDPDNLAVFLDADGTDYVRGHAESSDILLAKRIRSAASYATLVESNDLLERAVDQADVGITIADARTDDEPLIYVNEGFARLTGYPVEETVGRNCRFLQGEDTDPETVATLRGAIENEEAVSVDIRNYHPDGEPFWNSLDLSPITGDDGELTHYIGFQRDVTERKRLAAELREQNERLEAFSKAVSHDLRNPLAVARGHLEGIENEDVRKAESALDRMEALIADVLALAREGEDVGETSRVSLGEVATYAWSMVETGDLDLAVADDEAIVSANRDRVVSLLENCFRNTVEHATGATTIRISVTEDGFVVADDGPGIPVEEREAVFERGHSTNPDGTGFGLAIVAAIADAHDWTVSITESDLGGAGVAFEGVDVVAREN